MTHPPWFHSTLILPKFQVGAEPARQGGVLKFSFVCVNLAFPLVNGILICNVYIVDLSIMLFDSLDRMSPSLSHRMCIPMSIFPGQDTSNRFIASLLLLMEKTIGQPVDLENTPPKTNIDTKNCSILEGSYTFSKAHHFVYPWSFLGMVSHS